VGQFEHQVLSFCYSVRVNQCSALIVCFPDRALGEPVGGHNSPSPYSRFERVEFVNHIAVFLAFQQPCSCTCFRYSFIATSASSNTARARSFMAAYFSVPTTATPSSRFNSSYSRRADAAFFKRCRRSAQDWNCGSPSWRHPESVDAVLLFPGRKQFSRPKGWKSSGVLQQAEKKHCEPEARKIRADHCLV
jgi:hypothetical protein